MSCDEAGFDFYFLFNRKKLFQKFDVWIRGNGSCFNGFFKEAESEAK